MAVADSFQLRIERLLALQGAVNEYAEFEQERIKRDVRFLEAIKAGRKRGEAAQIRPIRVASFAAMTDLYDYLAGREDDDDSFAIRPPRGARRPPTGGGGTTYPPPPNPPQLEDGDMICHHCWGWGTEVSGGTCPLCTGKKKLRDQQLSPHFKLSQLVDTSVGRTYRIPNDPADSDISSMRRLCIEILEKCISGYDSSGLNILSGFRSADVNNAAGGVLESAHLSGVGADVAPKSMPVKGLMDWLVASGIGHDQFIYETTWVHTALYHPRAGTQRGDNLQMIGGRYFPYQMNA